MERRVPRSGKYARGGRELNNRSAWKASVFTGPVSACTDYWSNIDVLVIMWKTPTHATKLSSLGKAFPHSSLEEFCKGLGYVPSLSIMSLVSLWRQTAVQGQGRSTPVHLSLAQLLPSFGKHGSNHYPCRQDTCNSRRHFLKDSTGPLSFKIIPLNSVFAYPHEANPLGHVLFKHENFAI